MHHIELPHHHGEGAETVFIQEQLTHVNDFQTVAEVFKQLGDTTRIRIFWLLCHMEECVVNISAMLEMSSPAVSHHLRPLKNSGLIVSRREGKEVYYRAADTDQSHLLHQMIEQVMEIACPNLGKMEAHQTGELMTQAGQSMNRSGQLEQLTNHPSEQIETVRAVHEYLMQNIDQRITIDTLAKQYLINPTTLKEVFKSVYGTSIAAHIKEHRMELAARLLLETTLSIAEIGQQVGYESQSKFSAAFKAYFHMLPKEYRKNQQSRKDT